MPQAEAGTTARAGAGAAEVGAEAEATKLSKAAWSGKGAVAIRGQQQQHLLLPQQQRTTLQQLLPSLKLLRLLRLARGRR